MKIYELSQIGTFHTNHNEDAYVIEDLGRNKLLIAVMDGCSMGKESHFASTLIAKVLRKISKAISYRVFIQKEIKTIKEYLTEILENLFLELSNIQHQLMLEKEEMLSTLIIGVIDRDKRTAEILTVGDGIVCFDGQLVEYEQDDKPDYLGYHLSESFNEWYQKQDQYLSLNGFTDLSISTDGIHTFKPFDIKEYDTISETSIINFLMIDAFGADQENMLNKKLLHLKAQNGLIPGDDLTIVRVILK